MNKILTLAVIIKNNEILLGYKKAGFGQGLWNGFGGKVEPGESIEAAAKREVHEESSLMVQTIEKSGIMIFKIGDDPILLEMHIFNVKDFTGEPAESREMRPQWFLWSEIPYNQMWPEDRIWLPILKRGKKFQGRADFTAEHDIISCDIKTVETL